MVVIAILSKFLNWTQTLKKQFVNAYKFSNHINKFILLQRKGVYPYEYMDDWGKLTKHHCLKKKIFTVI